MREGVGGAGNDASLFIDRQPRRIERGREGAPVQAAPLRMGREMACAETLRQAELCRFFQKESRAEIRTFGNIEPAERRRSIDCGFEKWCRIATRFAQTKVAQVLPDQLQASSRGEVGQ